MRSNLVTFWSTLALSLAASSALAQETNCTDGVDNDGDTVFDCGDNDCAKLAVCKPDGGSEATEARCSDWIDNDNDGHVDCDDDECIAAGVRTCKGSWDLQREKSGPTGGGQGSSAALPDLPEGGSLEDLIGKAGDIDGERNDIVCGDGIDNDGDGAIDCADYGCRFDPAVSVCRESPGLRFSIVSHITASYDFEAEQADTRFSTLQLRAFGPMPFIQDSFFLISMRTERSPRLTFAMFQVPIGGGHYVNINSGGGALSTALIRSASKQLLVQAPFYLYSAFEQGNGAAVEVGGPIGSKGKLRYQAFVGAGSGRFNGNVGGRFFSFDNTNFTYAVGGQLQWNAIGHISRWDSPKLYVPVPTALSLTLGAKYDQRAQERYPAANLNITFRSGILYTSAETYAKRELEFGSWQVAYNVQVGVLVLKKHLLLAADFGQFHMTDMDNPPATAETDIRRLRNETQFRVGLHWYFWRNIGTLSLVYNNHDLGPTVTAESTIERELSLVAQYRF